MTGVADEQRTTVHEPTLITSHACGRIDRQRVAKWARDGTAGETRRVRDESLKQRFRAGSHAAERSHTNRQALMLRKNPAVPLVVRAEVHERPAIPRVQ